MNVFLYVEPFEVRKEVVLRPLDLARFIPLDVEPHEPIPPEQRPAILERIAEFLADRAPVVIDGVEVAPVLDRVHFLKRGLRMTRVVTPDEPIDGTNAVVGAIFVYPIAGIPDEVRMDWDLFDDRIDRVPAAATDAAGPMPSVLTPGDTELRWVNHLKQPTRPNALQVIPMRSRVPVPVVPVLAVLIVLVLTALAYRRRSWRFVAAACIVGTLAWFTPTPSLMLRVPSRVRAPSGTDAAPTLHALLYNTYRALDFRDEEVIFDRLAQSLSGDVLERVYLEMQRGLRLENQGGAQVRVRDVELTSAAPDCPPTAAGPCYRTTWNATGTVGHWGHMHTRTNRYDALITLAPQGDSWKIADLEILEESRMFQVR